MVFLLFSYYFNILTTQLLSSQFYIKLIIMNEVILQVKGMTCSHCEMSVKKALKAIKGVKDVKVSYKSGLAEIVVKEGKTSPVELIEAVEAEGYKATSA